MLGTQGQLVPPLICAWPSTAPPPPQENPGLKPQESPTGVHEVLIFPLIFPLILHPGAMQRLW